MPDLPVRWRFADTAWSLGNSPRLMGILNVTPDSFSDGGSWTDSSRAVEQGLALEAAGAEILDVGGESTRPGAEPVSEAEELRRVLPVIERLAAELRIPISVDTMKAAVAREALAAGARVVNDVSAGRADPHMLSVCADSDCGVVLMHMLGTPQTMQQNPTYTHVVAEVVEFLKERLQVFVAGGVAAERIVLDPGIGFGKSAAHNLQLLRGIPKLREIGQPVLIGHSRKRFLKHLLGREVEERLAGTIGVAIGAAALGADIIRVHDVQAVRDALAAWQALINQPEAT